MQGALKSACPDVQSASVNHLLFSSRQAPPVLWYALTACTSSFLQLSLQTCKESLLQTTHSIYCMSSQPKRLCAIENNQHSIINPFSRWHHARLNSSSMAARPCIPNNSLDHPASSPGLRCQHRMGRRGRQRRPAGARGRAWRSP